MSKPVGKTETSLPNPNSFKSPESDKKVINAFDVLKYTPKPKKSTSCRMTGCAEIVSLAFKNSTCAKCDKAFCRVHIDAEVHACMKNFDKI